MTSTTLRVEQSRSPSSHELLPEHDDGMQQLRQKLHEIRRLATNADDMAQQMHQLMSGEYLVHRPQPDLTSTPLPTDTLHTPSYVRPSSADLEPTFAPNPVLPTDDDGLAIDPAQRSVPIAVYGCQHYQRNVKIQCFDCHRWYTCRHCHDQAPDLPFPHTLHRQKTQSMLCMLCCHVQPAASFCINCGRDTAYYYCSKCKLWDNDSTKRIYHCDDCGICRRGEGLGRDYVHCKRCNVCISISTAATHPCIERATDCDCPLCLEYLFSSSTSVVSLFCGHYMHASCYKELMNVTYRCPICNKSAVNMELQWKKLDDEIMMQPMPEADFEDAEDMTSPPGGRTAIDLDEQTDTQLLAAGLGSLHVINPIASPSDSNSVPRPARKLPRRVWVGCNDCGGRGWTAFHWLGLKCPHCDGYNTTQTNPIGRTGPPRTRTDGQCQRQFDLTGAEAMRSFGGGIMEGDETLDDAVASRGDGTFPGSASSVSPSQYRNGGDHPRAISVQRYFSRPEPVSARSPPDGHAMPEAGSPLSLPYDLLQRMSRSLSPMRSYIDGFGPRERALSATQRISQYAATLAVRSGGGDRDMVTPCSQHVNQAHCGPECRGVENEVSEEELDWSDSDSHSDEDGDDYGGDDDDDDDAADAEPGDDDDFELPGHR